MNNLAVKEVVIEEVPVEEEHPTEELSKKAIECGVHGGDLAVLGIRADIDAGTVEKHYRKFFRIGKNNVVMYMAGMYFDMIHSARKEAKTVADYCMVCRMIMRYLSIRGGEEWSGKQQIEQTNVNVEAPPQTDLSNLTEEEKDTLEELILKAKAD